MGFYLNADYTLTLRKGASATELTNLISEAHGYTGLMDGDEFADGTLCTHGSDKFYLDDGNETMADYWQSLADVADGTVTVTEEDGLDAPYRLVFRDGVVRTDEGRTVFLSPEVVAARDELPAMLADRAGTRRLVDHVRALLEALS